MARESYYKQEQDMLFEILQNSITTTSSGGSSSGGSSGGSSPSPLPNPTSIGIGDKIRLDAIPLFQTPLGKTAPTLMDQQGAYYYLSIVLNNPQAGTTQRTNETKLISGYSNIYLSSGFGNRNYGDSPGAHEGIDIAKGGGGLPMTCPFQKAKVIESKNSFGIMLLEEIDPSTNSSTGRYCRFLHSSTRKVIRNEVINFKHIVGFEGRVGRYPSADYPNNYPSSHSHFEMIVKAITSGVAPTVDGKSTKGTVNSVSNGYVFAPTLEEIKCAHGMSTTALKLPIISGNNYSCI
jgi:murein DD-endopeptidase MepM/ murein hydrolase activator NlpD